VAAVVVANCVTTAASDTFFTWDFDLENLPPTMPIDARVPAILALLERELAAFDELSATVAAAHLDAAIHQLRLFQLRR
jgi:hypothetical protein